MAIESKWAKYNSQIVKILSDPRNEDLGYTEIARQVFPEGEYKDWDVLRTYIRRNFGNLRKVTGDKEPKILIYDIETSLVEASLFWTGKQYIGHKSLKSEPKIITVAWKWLGDDKVSHLVWNDGDDKDLVQQFLAVYNQADILVTVNGDNFDNRWVNARAAKYHFPVNTHVKSWDIQKQAKRLFRLPSYSMDYMAKYFDVELKQSHEGIKMWELIQWGTPEEKAEYLQKMVDYNVGDIISTEELLLRFIPYMKTPLHVGVLTGKEKWTSPITGTTNVELLKTTWTLHGTIQRIMVCNDTSNQYKINNKQYIAYLKHLQKQPKE